MSRLLFVCSSGYLDHFFHFFRRHIRNRRENHAKQGKPEIIPQKHSCISSQGNSCIKNLRSEFAHSLYAVIHIQDCLGHNASLALFPKACTTFPHQTGIQDFFHSAIYIVGKTPHIKPLNIPGSLDNCNGGHIAQYQNQHIRKLVSPFQDIHQAAGHFPLKPGTCQKADIIDQTGYSHCQKHFPFFLKIGKHPVRQKICMMFRFHLTFPFCLKA